ncbi:IS701 family transposase [Microvirga soli]|uniref:IS701 family transposase n=1 Tax=Microvirga soli TaxID=1854496 RepID=UPI0019200E90|nr:transposase [Microvirga soli]
MIPPVPAPVLIPWFAPFASAFTAPTLRGVLVLIAGAILAPGRRTVTSALSIMGLRESATFHRVLNRNRWSPRDLACRLLHQLVGAFVPEGPVVMAIDETIERRWGAQIRARGIYRDPVRSSHGHFVKAAGLRWISLMLLAPIPWAGRVWALPFLTVLAPSERYARERGQRHKLLTDWARQMLLQVARWVPERQIIIVADMSYAAIELLATVRRHLTVITRLRLDARLFDPPPVRQPGQRGRPRVAGPRQPTLAQRLTNPATRWRQVTISHWYGEQDRGLAIASGTALWYHPGKSVPIRWVLVRDLAGELEPQALLCTDLAADPVDIVSWFVRRWSVEVTFAQVRRHLGVETQRQWSDTAIARTTPALLGLFSLVALWAGEGLNDDWKPRRAAWYAKSRLTFSDALAVVRAKVWSASFETSRHDCDQVKIPRALLNRLTDAACFPT